MIKSNFNISFWKYHELNNLQGYALNPIKLFTKVSLKSFKNENLLFRQCDHSYGVCAGSMLIEGKLYDIRYR